MKRFQFASLALMILSIVLFSCQKTDDIRTEDNSVAKEDTYAENLFESVSDIADEAYDMKTGNLKSTEINRIFLSECATVTLDTTVMPRVLTVDFGEENCLCNDGKYRRGQIIITFNGRYRQPGTVITHGFNNFYVDDNQVDGTKVVTNMGLNTSNNIYFTIEVVGVINLAGNGGTISWNSSREREWIQGFETGNRWDDIYLITGEASGIRPNGSTWTREIINPLRIELACRFIVSGTVEIVPENRPARILDFGSGDCDNVATVIVNGVTYTIYLTRP
jgi:hypothetical protein